MYGELTWVMKIKKSLNSKYLRENRSKQFHRHATRFFVISALTGFAQRPQNTFDARGALPIQNKYY